MFDYSLTYCGALHPLIAHCLIFLLLFAPIPVLVGLGIPPEKRQVFLGFALAMMVLGTAFTFVAFTTGEAAMDAVSFTPAVRRSLAEHRTLAQTTRALFSVLTLGFAALLFVPRLLGRELESSVRTALLAIYLVFYTSGALFLVHTALQGGQVVRGLEERTAATFQLRGKVRLK